MYVQTEVVKQLNVQPAHHRSYPASLFLHLPFIIIMEPFLTVERIKESAHMERAIQGLIADYLSMSCFLAMRQSRADLGWMDHTHIIASQPRFPCKSQGPVRPSFIPQHRQRMSHVHIVWCRVIPISKNTIFVILESCPIIRTQAA